MLLSYTPYADASCGIGKHPSYSDIRAIRYARTSCFGKCPDYEVLFSDLGLYYAGRRWVKMTGTYEAEHPTDEQFRRGVLPASFRLAVRLLERYDFFDLSVEPVLVTDVPHYIIAVERCNVTTKLDMPSYPERRDVEGLFDALDVIKDQVHWTKTSDTDASPLSLYATIFP